jgi:hypothetical protein
MEDLRDDLAAEGGEAAQVLLGERRLAEDVRIE